MMTDKCIRDNGDGTCRTASRSYSSIDAGTWKWTNSFADYSPYYIPDDMKDRLTMGERYAESPGGKKASGSDAGYDGGKV